MLLTIIVIWVLIDVQYWCSSTKQSQNEFIEKSSIVSSFIIIYKFETHQILPNSWSFSQVVSLVM